MLIRRCLLSDAPAVAELATELGYPSDAAQAGARLAWLLGRDEDAVFAAEVDGAVAGWLHAREVRLLESEPFGEIAGLIVAAPRREQGIGKALLQAAIAWTAERGLPTLRVRSNILRTETHRWYQAAGFEILKTQLVFSRPSRLP
jgi:ribosomal protein S18 acetylase RimI-like enzyme